MNYLEIYNALENRELELTPNNVAELATLAATNNEHIDCDFLRDVIMAVQAVKKTDKLDFEEAKKEIQKANKEILAEKGKAYWKTLKIGDTISWQSTGKILTGTVGENKNSSKTAHCLLNEIPVDSKAKNPKLDRYVKYEKIIIPEDFNL